MKTLSFKISSDLTEVLRRLDNAYANAYAMIKSSTEAELTAMHRYARISMIGASTRIENALLTDIEINWIDTILTHDGKTTAFENSRALIENKLSKDRERSIEEVAGCRTMLMLIYQNPHEFFPIKENDIRALHYELLSVYSRGTKFAGNYKEQSNSVIETNKSAKSTRTIFETAPPGPITSAAMSDLVQWYNETMTSLEPPVAIATEFVYRFLAIHPFADGNGRLGRGLFLLSLLHSKSEVISVVSNYLAIDRYIEKYKEEYYYALNRSSDGKFRHDPSEYKIEYFLKFMLKVLGEAILGIGIAKQRFLSEQKLSESSSLVLQCFKDYPEIRLTTSSIMEQTRLSRRAVIYSLNQLLAAELIQKSGEGSSTRYQLTF